MKKSELIRKLSYIKSQPSRQYPDELKAEVLSYVEKRRKQRIKVKDLEKELGISRQTLYEWRNRTEATQRFHKVEVISTEKEPCSRAEEKPIRVLFPNGISIEGLDIIEVKKLMRSMI